MLQPLVSIIIPTYNRAHLIGETLDSVLAQTYTHWECIIIDDGSTDDTVDLVGSYVKKDSRFKYLHRPSTHKSGGNGARNYGFKISKGMYIQWIDDDDVISKDKIIEQVTQALKNPDCDLVTCLWAKYVNELNFSIRKKERFYKNYSNPISLIEDLGEKGGLFPSHVYLVKRDVMDKSGLWDESLIINQDGEFFCRVIINCNKILFTDRAIAYYRVQNGSNISHIDSLKKAEQRIKTWRMINNHIKLKFGLHNSKYVLKGKKSCFKKIKKQYPLLIFKHLVFFKTEIISLIRLKIKKGFKTAIK